MMRQALLSLVLIPLAVAIPAEEHNFTQMVDHFSTSYDTFQQRYYENTTWFAGPGNPIICILGGEGSVPPSTGIFYPFITDIIAQEMNALVIEPEHRYYGTSLPFGEDSFSNEALRLLTPQQALADAAYFITETRKKYNCTEPGTPGYCPALTVGGSYPGWLSAMMRVRYPGVVDMAYSASAPMLFYTQQVNEYDYYQRVTESAEKAVSGCSDAVRTALTSLVSMSKDEAIDALDLCTPLPDYLEAADDQTFFDELNMVFMYTFAGLNMANYPPEGSDLQSVCTSFVNSDDLIGSLHDLLVGYAAPLPAKRPIIHRRNAEGSCFDLSTQLPNGHNATITGGDWSGCGTGSDGEMWDYETCNFLVEQIGVNNETDMFPAREWTFDWLNQHCASRFDAIPQPRALADEWGFDDLVNIGATRIVFTNGLNDGWSVGGITTNLSESLLAVNMENGAHHSDLSHSPPSDDDTPDVTAGRQQVSDILMGWLAEIQEQMSI